MSDLISRKAAIDAISSMFAPTPVQKDMVEDCLEIIENLPSAEPKTGKWIPLGKRPGWVCSRCREEDCYAFKTNASFEYVLQDYFCPNCGAKMKGEDE